MDLSGKRRSRCDRGERFIRRGLVPKRAALNLFWHSGPFYCALLRAMSSVVSSLTNGPNVAFWCSSASRQLAEAHSEHTGTVEQEEWIRWPGRPPRRLPGQQRQSCARQERRALSGAADVALDSVAFFSYRSP